MTLRNGTAVRSTNPHVGVYDRGPAASYRRSGFVVTVERDSAGEVVLRLAL